MKMRFQMFVPVAVSAAVAMSVVAPIRAAEKEVPHISHAELTKAIQQKRVVLLDVNGTESYKSGHIPRALNFEAVQGNLKKVLPANKKALIVAYCGGPLCGAYKMGAEAAKKLGYTNIKHYSPGISGWKKSGAKVVKG
jgi:rhodanese-related sulfurtransferase